MLELASDIGYTDDQLNDLKIQTLTMSAEKASQTIEWLKEEREALRANPDMNLRTSATQVAKHLEKL
jgi:hypothetical protein